MSTMDENTLRIFTLINEIGIINQLSSTRFQRLLPEGLTVAQFSVLNNFVRLGGTRTPVQLATAFQVTKGAMTNTLKRLEASKCITIKASQTDGRKKEVSITAKGRRTRERAIRSTEGEMLIIEEALDEKQVNLVLPILQTLRKCLDSNR